MTSWKDRLALTAQRNRQEIVKAKLDRREMMRLGLLTAGGALIAKAGLSSRAYGQAAPTLTDPDATLSRVPASPPMRPWVQPMPRLTLKTPMLAQDMDGGCPDGTTPIDGATKRIPHQYFSYTPPTDGGPVGTYGPSPANPTYNFAPKKFYELEMEECFIKVHPDYAPTRFFAFDGVVPGPLIQAKYGEPVLVRYKNKLPSVKIPQDFGIAEMTTHLHNGHTPSESDGNPVNYFNSINDPNAVNPLGFKDQHYPNVYAGFRDPQYGSAGNPNEALGSLWYHDHHLDFTAQNVYKGMFGCYNLFDPLDSGDGHRPASAARRITTCRSSSTTPCSTRTARRCSTCSIWTGSWATGSCANGVIQPNLDVKKCRYRFRLYAPGPSRWWEWSLWDGTNFLPFWQISTDGNLLPNAVQVTSVRIAVAERVDIIVDFSKIKASRIYFVNRAEQVNGRGPTGKTLSPGTPVLQVNIGAAVVG